MCIRDRPLEHPVWFIDGVRRLEARVTAKLDGQYSYGAFGAYGVGAVQIDRDQACFERFLTGRVFALCSADPVSYTHLDVYKRQLLEPDKHTPPSWFHWHYV